MTLMWGVVNPDGEVFHVARSEGAAWIGTVSRTKCSRDWLRQHGWRLARVEVAEIKEPA